MCTSLAAYMHVHSTPQDYAANCQPTCTVRWNVWIARQLVRRSNRSLLGRARQLQGRNVTSSNLFRTSSCSLLIRIPFSWFLLLIHDHHHHHEQQRAPPISFSSSSQHKLLQARNFWSKSGVMGLFINFIHPFSFGCMCIYKL